MMRILLAEDDPRLGKLIEYMLSQNKFSRKRSISGTAHAAKAVWIPASPISWQSFSTVPSARSSNMNFLW